MKEQAIMSQQTRVEVASAEQLEAWKKTYGEVYAFQFYKPLSTAAQAIDAEPELDRVFYFRPANRRDLAQARQSGIGSNKDPDATAIFLMSACQIDGKTELFNKSREMERYVGGLALDIYQIADLAVATLKKY